MQEENPRGGILFRIQIPSSERCKRPSPNPAVPFVSSWFFFKQKNCDFESRRNSVIATTIAGSSLAVIRLADSFVGISVAYSSAS